MSEPLPIGGPRGPGWPLARPGQAVGLLGGSFDPAHDGHLHISREAIKRFGLGQVWWLVSPGNPLKSRAPAPLAERMARARALTQDDPRLVVSDVEARLGTRLTVQTLRALTARYPGTRFTWLMGADNLAQFHLWAGWEEIMRLVPLGVLARPGQRISARMSPAARIYRQQRLPRHEARALPWAAPPAWCFLNIPMRLDSSTALRQRGAWPGGGSGDTADGTGEIAGKPGGGERVEPVEGQG